MIGRVINILTHCPRNNSSKEHFVTTPWGAVRAEHKQQLRHRIAEAARDLALEHGLAAATMGAVAKRVNVSRATVYNYFPDVEHALLWAVGEEVDRFTATLEQDLHGDAPGQLRACVRTQLTYFASPERRAAALYFKVAGLSPLVRDRMREHTARLTGMLTRIVADGVAGGEFRSDLDPGRCAQLITALLAGVREQLLRGDAPPDTLMREALDFIEHGLLVRGAAQDSAGRA
jgi:AcrR family transcriptional regulator